jgi:hypothetical protein
MVCTWISIVVAEYYIIHILAVLLAIVLIIIFTGGMNAVAIGIVTLNAMQTVH